jgi:prolyl-tRNA synthetase
VSKPHFSNYRGPIGATRPGSNTNECTDCGNLRDSTHLHDRRWNFAGEPVGALEKVQTQSSSTIESVCQSLGIQPNQFLKTTVFHATSPIFIRWVVAVVRGDKELDQGKLSEAAQLLGVTNLRPAEESPDFRTKFAVGFVGPDAGTKLPDAVLIVDPDAAQGDRAWVAGANEVGYHVRNFNWFREAGDKLADPTKVLVADIIAG